MAVDVSEFESQERQYASLASLASLAAFSPFASLGSHDEGKTTDENTENVHLYINLENDIPAHDRILYGTFVLFCCGHTHDI